MYLILQKKHNGLFGQPNKTLFLVDQGHSGDLFLFA